MGSNTLAMPLTPKISEKSLPPQKRWEHLVNFCYVPHIMHYKNRMQTSTDTSFTSNSSCANTLTGSFQLLNTPLLPKPISEPENGASGPGCLLPSACEAALPAPSPAPSSEQPPVRRAALRSETESAMKWHTKLEIAELLMRNG